METKFNNFALLVFLLAAAITASGQTKWYPVYEKDNPTPVDLVMWDGEPHSIIVQILNLTPYEIKYNSAPEAYTMPDGTPVALLKDSYDVNRHTKKSFIFASVGIPNTIPGLPISAFADRCQYTAGCTPAQPGSVTGRPYSMVLSWDDYNGLVKFSSVFWTIKNAQECVGPSCADLGDVPVGLYMSRIEPPPVPISGFIKILVGAIKMVASAVKLGLGDPLAAFELVGEYKDTTTEAIFVANQMNKEGDGGVKMYVSAFPPPGNGTSCYNNPGEVTCYPSSAAHDDATDAGWNEGIGGRGQGQFVVTTHVIRGKRPTPGYLPVVMITVMRTEDYGGAQVVHTSNNLTSIQLRPEVRAIFEQLRHLLNKHGYAGTDALTIAIGALNPDQRASLREVMRTLWTGKDITNAQRQFLQSLVVQLRLLLNDNEEA